MKHAADKNNNTKRDLIKQRNYLMQENDSLMFKFKKLFLFWSLQSDGWWDDCS